MKKSLVEEGYDVVSSVDGVDALDKLRNSKPDIVLLDLFMPVKDGFQFLKEKKEDREFHSVPVIVISESNDPKHIDDALMLGVRDYVSKNQLDMKELFEKIKVQLGTPIDDNDLDDGKVLTNISLEGFKILWVEDDTYLVDIISRKLANDKCTLLHAKTGEEAMEMGLKENPDIVMLDILLPGINGFEVLERFKKDEKLKDIPIILTSNLGQKDDIERGEKLGARKFLVKATVTLDEIIQEMKRVLSRMKKK